MQKKGQARKIARKAKTSPSSGASPSSVGRAAGVSKQLASRKLRQGKSPGDILDEAERRRERLAQRRGSPGASEADETFAEAQRRKETALADGHELKVRILRGELVESAAVELWMTNQIIRARDLFLRVGAELGERLAAETSPHKCAEMVESKVREALAVMRIEGMPGKENQEDKRVR